MLAKLVTRAQERGAHRLVGEYVASDKNKVVAELFPRLGFASTDNSGLFTLEISNASFPQTFISVGAGGGG